MDFNTTLLREKFVIRDMKGDINDTPLVAMSNRIAVNLTDARGITLETIIVRAQNMHMCIRMAGKIVQTFRAQGPILVRNIPYDWEDTWERLIGEHERTHNPDLWVAVFAKGRRLFTRGEYHPFLDLIEKCDAANPENYDASVRLAEEAFSQLGKEVSVVYESNIGMVIFIEGGKGRCGIILRNSERNSTFNFRVEDTAEYAVSPVQCLNVCAAFLEGIQLSFVIGVANEKQRMRLISTSDKESLKAKSSLRRLGSLNAEIATFERDSPVHYRPERPEFKDLINEAERFAADVFGKDEEGKEKDLDDEDEVYID